MSEAGFDDKHSHPSWIKALQETILALKLDVVAVGRILAAWTAAPAGGNTPDRDRIWYRQNRDWVKTAAGHGMLYAVPDAAPYVDDPWAEGGS